MLSVRLNQYYGRLRRPPGTPLLSRDRRLWSASFRQHPDSAGCRAGEGLPSSRRHCLNVPCPIRRGVPHGCAPGSPPLPWPSPCFRGLGTPCTHPEGWTSNDAAGFASRYGPLSCSPHRGFRHWASTRPVSKPSRQSATGPPGSYPDRTPTGKQRRADEPRSPIQGHLQFCWAHERPGLGARPTILAARPRMLAVVASTAVTAAASKWDIAPDLRPDVVPGLSVAYPRGAASRRAELSLERSTLRATATGPPPVTAISGVSPCQRVGPVGLEPTTRGLKVRCSAS